MRDTGCALPRGAGIAWDTRPGGTPPWGCRVHGVCMKRSGLGERGGGGRSRGKRGVSTARRWSSFGEVAADRDESPECAWFFGTSPTCRGSARVLGRQTVTVAWRTRTHGMRQHTLPSMARPHAARPARPGPARTATRLAARLPPGYSTAYSRSSPQGRAMKFGIFLLGEKPPTMSGAFPL